LRTSAVGDRRAWWTVANQVTATRALVGVSAGGLMLHERTVGVAVWLFALAMSLDWVDGWLARRLGQESSLGALLDPIVDKIVMTAAYGAIGLLGHSPAIWLLFTLGVMRDSVVTAERLRQYLTSGKPFESDRVGKTKTCVQSLGVLAIVSYKRYIDPDFSFASPIVVVIFATVVILSFVSWGRYTTARRARERRRGAA
jgi:CDP-diacylglycerol--glycerol-3-phosphate 3-phosphatidyltransferase